MKNRLFGILDKFRGKKIMVIGDLMLDKYVWGAVDRISPEAPVPIVEVSKETHMPGGAGNAATNVAALGGKVFVVGAVGNDPARALMLKKFSSLGIVTRGIFSDRERPTTQKVRVFGHSQQLIRFDYEKTHKMSSAIEKKMKKYISGMAGKMDAIIISDYAKGVVTGALVHSAISSARKAGVPVIVDPKPKNAELYKGATLVTPNHKEASQISGIEDGSEEQIALMGKRIMDKLGSNVLITRGEKGMSLCEKNGRVTNIPTKAREVYDVSGAGDTVTAAVALALASRAGLLESAMIANYAAGVTVGKIGTSTVAVNELKRAIENDNLRERRAQNEQ